MHPDDAQTIRALGAIWHDLEARRLRDEPIDWRSRDEIACEIRAIAGRLDTIPDTY